MSALRRLVLQAHALGAVLLVVILVLSMVAYILTAPMFGGGTNPALR